MFSFSIEKLFPNEQGEFSFRRLLVRIFIDDWLMKLIALVITLALWFGVTGLRTPIDGRLENVALKIRLSNDMVITNTSIEEVDLIVRGDKNKIDSIREKDIIVSLDLTNAQPGERTVEIKPESVNLDLPTGIKLEEVQPSKIAVKIEAVEKREIPVKAETENNLPEGFEIYGVSAIPQKVPVRGPTSYINSIDSISTEKIDLKDRQTDFTAQQVPLNITNPQITIVDETFVSVFFRIGERRIERLFIVPLKNEKEKRSATVVLYGARSLLNSIKSEDLQVEISKSESNTDLLNLNLPAELQGQVEIRKLQINGR
jgi:YbbR domain-containing protein